MVSAPPFLPSSQSCVNNAHPSLPTHRSSLIHAHDPVFQMTPSSSLYDSPPPTTRTLVSFFRLSHSQRSHYAPQFGVLPNPPHPGTSASYSTSASQKAYRLQNQACQVHP